MMQSIRAGRSIPAIPALLGLALTALLGLSLAWGTAWAQTGSQATAAPEAAAAPAAAPEGEPAGEPASVMRQPEQLRYKPSGFWTSGRPAVGGAYRYRLLGVGVAVVVLTGVITLWVVRRHPARHA